MDGSRLAQLAQHLQVAAPALPASVTAAAASAGRRPRIAAVCTTWWPQSHADVIVWKLLKGTTTDEGYFPPEVDIVSIFMDQQDGRFSMTEAEAVASLGKGPEDEYAAFTAASASQSQDNGGAIAEAAGIPVVASIMQALSIGKEGNELNVDGIHPTPRPSPKLVLPHLTRHAQGWS